MRTFIAVDPPDGIKAGISGFIQRIKRTAPGGIGWANPADFHLTLKFLGDVEEASAESIGDVVRGIAADTPVFPLTAAGTGFFPPRSPRPRVLWIGIEESAPLKALQGRLEDALEPLGFIREDRPFHPHLTAARIRSGSVPPRILEQFAAGSGLVFGDFLVREMIFYQSLLRPSGAEHRPLVSGVLRT